MPNKEVASGAVVYKIVDNAPHYLLLKSATSDFWGFPKGHVEAGEDLIETAHREILEETGLDVQINTDFNIFTHYPLPNGADKEVTFFISQIFNENNLKKQDIEISQMEWCDYTTAHDKLTFDNLRAILVQAHQYIVMHQA